MNSQICTLVLRKMLGFFLFFLFFGFPVKVNFIVHTQNKEEEKNIYHTGCLKKTWTFFEIGIIPLFIKESSQNFVW